MNKVFQNTNPLIKVGKVTEAHSLQGEVKVHLFSGEAPWLGKVKSVFLQMQIGKPDQQSKQDMQEFKITTSRSRNGLAILKFDEIPDRTAAEKLKGAEVFILAELLTSVEGENIYLNEILNFEVWTLSGKLVGRITSFDTNSHQDLLVVDVQDDGGNYSALIPLIKPFLISIDYSKKTVTMDLPAGLIEANRAL